jgi:twitching motility protein PilT
MDIYKLLEKTARENASDLHLKANAVPKIRVDGSLQPVTDEPPLTVKDTERVFESVTSERLRELFRQQRELDFSMNVPEIGRFRVNSVWHRGSICLSFRYVPLEIPTIEKFGLPEVCKHLASKPRGLVLVTGPTGSGKSTTLAAMINHLNEQYQKTVICIEDPVEFVYEDRECFIIQRDLGDDTLSFSNALTRAFRHDPDVIMIGEMRDLETISTAITAAETGHLVLSTLHTFGAAAAIDRMIDVFPPYQQPQIRSQLASVLQGVLSEVLLRRGDGRGRLPAFEIMLGNYAISNLIRESRTHEVPGIIETSSQQGMQTLDQALEKLIKTGRITLEEALKVAQRPDELKNKNHTNSGKPIYQVGD